MLKANVDGDEGGWIQSDIWIGGGSGSGSLIQRLETEEDQGAEQILCKSSSAEILYAVENLGFAKSESDIRGNDETY